MATNQTASLAAANDIRDIKPPVEISSGWEWLWWTLGALAVAAFLFALWRWWQKRKANIPIVPPVPAHVRAKEMLEKALALIAHPKPFCTLVSDTVRTYLEERFDFHAPERTTEEFLHELRGTNLLSAEQKEKLGEFLECCDLVKFAKYEPVENELRDLHGSALRLVEETEPQVLPEQEQATVDNTFQAETKLFATDVPIPAQPAIQNALKGKTLAIVGTLLQLGPSIWIVAYVIMLIRMLILANNLPQAASSKGIGVFTELYSKMLSIYGVTLLLVCVGLLAGIVGLVLLIISLVSLRYRSEWFFWFLIIYGVLLLGAFPCIGTTIGIFIIVYCLTKRREFLNRT